MHNNTLKINGTSKSKVQTPKLFLATGYIGTCLWNSSSAKSRFTFFYPNGTDTHLLIPLKPNHIHHCTTSLQQSSA